MKIRLLELSNWKRFIHDRCSTCWVLDVASINRQGSSRNFNRVDKTERGRYEVAVRISVAALYFNYQSFRKNETGGFSLAQSQIMSEELTLLHLSRVSAAYPPVYVLLLPNLMNPWLRALIPFDVWRLFSWRLTPCELGEFHLFILHGGMG